MLLYHDSTHQCESTSVHILCGPVPFEYFTELLGRVSNCQIQEIRMSSFIFSVQIIATNLVISVFIYMVALIS